MKVPDDILECFFLEHDNDREKICEFVDKNVIPYINKWFPNDECFLKNGCFSNKFDFNSSCHVTSFDTESIVDHILNIEDISLMVEASGDLEFAFREYVRPHDDSLLSIYNGMTLIPEFRVFYDFDNSKVLYVSNYWDYDYCYDTVKSNNEKDGDIFDEAYKSYIKQAYESNKDIVAEEVHKLMKGHNELCGIWSVDVMMNGDELWLIDMALGYRSAYWDPMKAFPKFNKIGILVR